MSDTSTYILDPSGMVGYCFDPIKKEIRSRHNGIETVLKAGSEEMGKANDARTGHTHGYGVGEQGQEITKEEYDRL